MIEKDEDRSRIEEELKNTMNMADPSLYDLKVCQIELEMQIAELQRAQVLMQAEKEHYCKLYNEAPVALITFSDTDFIIDANSEAEALLGLDRSSLTTQRISQCICTEDLNLFNQNRRMLEKTGETQDFEVRMIKKDEIVFWAQIIVKLSNFGSDQPLVFFLVVKDIGERKAVESSLHEALLLQQVLLDAVPSPVFYKDSSYVYLGCNKAFSDYIGHTKEQVIGKTVYELFPSDLAKVYEEADRALLNKQGIQNYEARVKYADGTRHDVVFNKSVFKNIQGKVAGIIGVIFDISEQKNADRKIQKLLEEKELILKEVHHRIKNNMSLLQKQRPVNVNAAKKYSGRASSWPLFSEFHCFFL